MDYCERWGYQVQLLTNKVCCAIASGCASEPVVLFRVKSPPKEVKRIRKAISSSDAWVVNSDHQTVWHAGESRFKGFASWGPVLNVCLCGYSYRFKVFHVDRFQYRTVFLIPILKAGSFTSLPGCDYSSDEIIIMRTMADQVLQRDEAQEWYMELRHPARETLLFQLSQWRNESYDENELLKILDRQPLIWEAAITALDAQLHVFKRMKHAPRFLVNFVRAKGSDLTPNQWVREVLGTFCFSNEPGNCRNGVISIKVKEAEDIRRAEKYPERMVLMEAGTGTQHATILKKIESYDNGIKAESLDHGRFLTTPIMISGSVCSSSWAIDIRLNKNMALLSDSEKITLRAAMAKVICKKVAKEIYDRWKEAIEHKDFFLKNGICVWRDLLRSALLDHWFSERQIEAKIQTEMEEYLRRRAEDDMKQAINQAVGILSDLDAKKEHIVPRPQSVEHWDELQADGAIAFHYAATKGQYKGKYFIAFDLKSFPAFLRQVGCAEEYADAVIAACLEKGIIENRDYAITLDKTVHCMLIRENCS